MDVLSPVVFGEVLFDEFEDGSTILGGAPFNVAWHLQGLGVPPLLISRVGEDTLGENILATMHDWGMQTRGVQIDDKHSTGTVTVSFDDDQPHFDIVMDVAYDYIDAHQSQSLLDTTACSILYHGTLATRSAPSRNTLHTLLECNEIPVFIDINLRPPHWNYDQLARLLAGASWLKINDHELTELSRYDDLDRHECMSVASQLRKEYQIENVIVTLGSDGAFAVTHEGVFDVPPVDVTEFIDSVGAGDAFSAVYILGQINQWDTATTLARAADFAASICEQRGATSADAAFYEMFMSEWGL
ncbi:MAG: carbohydrate kinase [Gammaproteobacteria bacterium]|nr:MAG: carbohydrate kinase [Gammaproteobacteria bacterium]